MTFFRMKPDDLLWVSSLSIAFSIGAIVSLILSMADASMRPVVVRSTSGATVASVVLEGFRDGLLRGQSNGPVRLFAGDASVDIASDGSFALDHPAFHMNTVTVHVPAGMRFVASKNGKKYYAVTSAAGERIALQNRVYFANEAAAEAAGFVR